MRQFDDINEAYVPVTTLDTAGVLFDVDCVEQVAIKLFQLRHAGFVENVVYPFAEDSFLIFLAFNLNEGMDRNIKRIGHIEDRFKRRALL